METLLMLKQTTQYYCDINVSLWAVVLELDPSSVTLDWGCVCVQCMCGYVRVWCKGLEGEKVTLSSMLLASWYYGRRDVFVGEWNVLSNASTYLQWLCDIIYYYQIRIVVSLPAMPIVLWCYLTTSNVNSFNVCTIKPGCSLASCVTQIHYQVCCTVVCVSVQPSCHSGT